jgi:hypothetical protein
MASPPLQLRPWLVVLILALLSVDMTAGAYAAYTAADEDAKSV